MMMKMRYLLADPRFMARDNEGEGDAGASDQTPDATAQAQAAAAAAKATEEATFNQAQVNDIVVKRNKKVQQQLETAEATIEKMLKTNNLSAQDRAGMEAQLETLQAEMRTKEQQATYEAKKLQAEYDQKLEVTSKEMNFYKTQFETSTRDNAIRAAASQHDAYNPDQFINVLSPRTEIVKETNEAGEETGRLVPRVKVEVKAEDGTVAEVLKTPAEAIEIMKGQPELFGNLFKGNVAKGIGEGSNNAFASGTKVDVTKMTDAEYFKNRDAIREQYGIKDSKSKF
jgi:hypothetical protein